MIGSAQLLKVFKLSPLPAVIVSPDAPLFTVVAANDAWLSLIGWTETSEAVIGKSLPVLLKDPALTLLLESVLQSKTESVYKYPRRPGLAHASNLPLLSEDGHVTYIVHQLSNVEDLKETGYSNSHVDKQRIKTEGRKKNKHESKLVSEDYNYILESIGDAYFAVDRNWIITYVNNNAAKIVGKTREEIVNRNLWELYPEEIGGAFYNNYVAAATQNETVRFEAYFDSAKVWLEVTVHPTDQGISVFIKDITLKQLADERIRDSEEKNRLIMNGALDAIICMDVHGDVIFWNPRAEAIFGWKADEVMGRRLSSFIIPEQYRERHDEGLRRYLSIHTTVVMNQLLELNGLRRNGEEFPIELTVIPIHQHTDEFFCAFIRDISERKIAEEQIRLSNQELEQFAYVASHDLQEPLRMVTSFLTQLEKRYADRLDDKAKQYIFFAVDGARRMRQIILDLLEFSRIGKWSQAREMVDLNQVVTEAMVLYSRQIEESEATINVNDLPVVAAYRTPLEQVFQNLISNALKYRREGVPPVIDITCKENNHEWIFSVADNGIGIAEENFDRIFVIFQRLHHRGEYTGTGIGLAIVKKIIANLGGKIWLEPRKGPGANFVFTVPKGNDSKNDKNH